MIHRLLTRLALGYLRRYAPWSLPYTPRRHRAQPTDDEATQRRWFAEIDERAAAREGRS